MLSVLLIVIQGAGWLALALMTVYHCAKANRALHSWPVTLEKINRWAQADAVPSGSGSEGDAAADMIGTLRAARLALEQAPSIPLELYPIAGSMQLLFQLTRYRKQLIARRTAGEGSADGGGGGGGSGSLAIQMDSVASSSSSSLTDNSRRAVAAVRGGATDPLSPAAAAAASSASSPSSTSSSQPHILEWSVQDAADDVAQLVARASRRTLLPNQLLERALDGMQTAMAVKARQHALMHPIKRRILLKLLAAHALRGDDEYQQQPQEDELAPLSLPQPPAVNSSSAAAPLHMSLHSLGGRARMSALATVAEQAGGEEEDDDDERAAFLDR